MDLKQASVQFIETLQEELAQCHLAITALQERVSKLENPDKVVEVPPPTSKVQSPPRVELVTKAIRSFRLKYAIAIVSTLLMNQREGKEVRTLSDILRVKFPNDRSTGIKSTQSTLDDLIRSQLVRESMVSSRRRYNVPESKVAEAQVWVQSQLSGDLAGIIQPPSIDVAVLDENPDGSFTITLPNNETRSSKRARDLKRIAKGAGFGWQWASDRLADKYGGRVTTTQGKNHLLYR